MDDVRAVVGDFEWSFLGVTSESYSADVAGFWLVVSECVNTVLPRRLAVNSVLALLSSHVWLSSTASQLRQVSEATYDSVPTTGYRIRILVITVQSDVCWE